MNRSELAALFAANPPLPLPAPASSSPTMAQDQDQDQAQHRTQKPVVSSPKSPRLAFQCRVRKLQQQRSPSRSSFNSHSRRHSELEHVSTLRVTHEKTRSARPMSQDTPDFWAEEREAWGQRSPQSPQPRIPFTETDVVPPTRLKLQPVLSPPHSQNHPIPQPRKQSQGQVALRIFEPSDAIPDADERPKTSRGPKLLGMLKEENEEAEVSQDSEDDEPPRLSTSTNRATRTSKFFEGSMNERSFGIASSWFHEIQSDSEKPLPPTPAVKHVTFSCTPVRESPEDKQAQATDLPTSNKRKERRGLRKSISNFNFQALSEKIRIFGNGPHHDLHPIFPAEKEKERSTSKTHLKGADVLSERKRKADEAYALQFGFKKQKSAGPSPAGSATLNASTTSPSISSSTTATTSTTPLPNLRKKKSRRELERENAELRARLDAQLLAHPSAPAAGAVAVAAPNTASPSLHAGGETATWQQRGGNTGELDSGIEKGMSGRVLSVLENGVEDGKGDGKGEEVKKVGIRGADGIENGNVGLRKSFEWPEDVF
jgi:hypothetical protein